MPNSEKEGKPSSNIMDTELFGPEIQLVDQYS